MVQQKIRKRKYLRDVKVVRVKWEQEKKICKTKA